MARAGQVVAGVGNYIIHFAPSQQPSSWLQSGRIPQTQTSSYVYPEGRNFTLINSSYPSSPVFRDMFSVPGLIRAKPLEPPIVDAHNSPEALETFLQITYSFNSPPIDDVETLLPVYKLADKNDAKVVSDCILSICFNLPPIQAYAIFRVCTAERTLKPLLVVFPFRL